MGDEGGIVKVHCNGCLRVTNHLVLKRRKNDGREEVDGHVAYWWIDIHEMLECCGCESVTLRHEAMETGMDEPVASLYPPAISRPLPRWLSGASGLTFRWRNDGLYSLLKEVYAALQAGSHRLALMGARALIDHVLNDKVGDVGGFADKLKVMEGQELITSQHRLVLDVAVNAGNAVTHRGYVPKEDELNQVMDIVENLIESAYILNEAAEALRKSVPPRTP